MDEQISSVFQRLEEKSRNPLEGIFYDGQIFDAHTFVCDLIRGAKQRIILINIETNAHDRFLIIDDKVYHIGASIKDLGKTGGTALSHI